MLDDRLLPTEFVRKNIFTGEVNSMVFDVSPLQLSMYENRVNVQDSFPQLSVDEREFLISGVLPEDQDQYWS
tara:strand:+ start:39 stop:254 length:216 start_codon:yes stop_codon:yes gene_type:complete